MAGLEAAEPAARTDFAKPLLHFQQLLHRRGIVLVLSDFYEAPETVVKTIEPLRFHGSEVVLFHILDPKEIHPDLRGPSILVDLETDQKLEVIPDYVKVQYRRKMDDHLEQMRDRTRAAGMGYHLLMTDKPLDTALSGVPLSLRGREPLMGFFAPCVFRWVCLRLGLPVFVHLLRRHTTTPRPVSSLMFFEAGTQSSTRHRRLRYLPAVCAAGTADSAAGAGVCKSVYPAGEGGDERQAAAGGSSTIRTACARARALRMRSGGRSRC